MATNFYDHDLHYLKNNIQEAFDDWFVARNIRDKEALANLTMISSR